MKDFLTYYKNPNEERMNLDIIKNYRDEPLIDYIIDICKGIEVTGYIKFMGYEYITDESKFDLTLVNKKHRKKRKGKKYADHNLDITVSRYDKLLLNFKIEYDGEVREVQNWLLIPKKYKNYYYLINGNKLYPIYQLVDNSTYSGRDKITLKTLLMPTVIKRKFDKFKMIDDKEFEIPYYIFKLFKKESPILIYYFATFGVKKTIRYFGLKGIIKVVESVSDDDKDYYYMKCNNNLYIKCLKFFFDADQFVRSIMAMMKMIMNGRKVNIDNYNDIDLWLTKLGSFFTGTPTNQHEKGKNVLVSFKRILDETTKKHLKLSDKNKKDMYAMVRWMTQNFNEIKLKDNLDLQNKRLRLSEYIAGYLSMKISYITYRILNRPKLLTLDYLESSLQFKPNEIINKLAKSPLLRYDNIVNDMDFFNTLKYSAKGPSSLGENGGGSISIKYRGIHPSHVGRLDLNTCSSSEPGLTGILSPFVDTSGLFFIPDQEPQSWEPNFKKIKEEYLLCLTDKERVRLMERLKQNEKEKNRVFKRIVKDNTIIDDVYDIILAHTDEKDEYIKIFNMDNSTKKEVEVIKVPRVVFKRIEKEYSE